MQPHEPVVSPTTPMPKGYGFLRKGNPYMTSLCRRKTHEARKTLYVVMNGTKAEGLRAPRWILGEVFADERSTREKRRDAVGRRDAATQDVFESAITALFPKIPKTDLAMILKRTLKKRSGRVGRTGTLELDEKAHLAVQAHVRHCHTDYDKIMKKSPDRDAARKAVQDRISQLLALWGGAAKTTKPTHRNRLGSKRRTTGPGSPHPTKRRRTSLSKSTGRIQTRARMSHAYKPSFKQAPKPLGSPRGLPAASARQAEIIDLTQDETDEEAGFHSSSDGHVSSGDEYEESEETDEDDLYELSDGVVDSGGDYTDQDSDWLSA